MRPKILFICAAPPFGEVAGMGHRIRNNASILSSVSDLTFIAIQRAPWAADSIEKTKAAFNFGPSFSPKPTASGMGDLLHRVFNGRYLNTQGALLQPADRDALQALIDAHDVTWVHTLKLANTLNIYRIPNSILDVDDLSSRSHATVSKNAANLKEKIHRKRLSITWKLRERYIFDRFSTAGVCKAEDRQSLRHPERAFVLPNTFHVPASDRLFNEELISDPRFGMIGNFEYRLNYDGIRWFIESCWKKVLAKLPHAQLRLVGKGSEKFHDESQNIFGLGFVPDSQAEMKTWTALISPTRMGGGSSVKVSEALAKQIPVVSTSHGARGYEVQSGEDILIADDSTTFANACLNLASDKDLRTKIAINAGKYYEKHLSLNSIKPTIEEAIKHALSHQFQTR